MKKLYDPGPDSNPASAPVVWINSSGNFHFVLSRVDVRFVRQPQPTWQIPRPDDHYVVLMLSLRE